MATNKVVTLSEDSSQALLAFGLTLSQVQMINAPTPTQWIKKRKGRGGKEFDYIPVGITVKCLNTIFGFGWSFEIVKEEIITAAKQVLVKGRLTVYIGDKTIFKDNFASKEVQYYSDKPDTQGKVNPRAGEMISIGDDMKGAASLCLTKCASMFGLFSDVYSSEFYARWEMPDGEDKIEQEDILFKTIIQTIEQVRVKDVVKSQELARKEINENKSLTEEQKEELKKYV